MSEKTPLTSNYGSISLQRSSDLSRLKNYQKYVFFVTFGSYFMSHFSRKCYSTVKKQLVEVREGGGEGSKVKRRVKAASAVNCIILISMIS